MFCLPLTASRNRGLLLTTIVRKVSAFCLTLPSNHPLLPHPGDRRRPSIHTGVTLPAQWPS